MRCVLDSCKLKFLNKRKAFKLKLVFCGLGSSGAVLD